MLSVLLPNVEYPQAISLCNTILPCGCILTILITQQRQCINMLIIHFIITLLRLRLLLHHCHLPRNDTLAIITICISNSCIATTLCLPHNAYTHTRIHTYNFSLFSRGHTKSFVYIFLCCWKNTCTPKKKVVVDVHSHYNARSCTTTILLFIFRRYHFGCNKAKQNGNDPR